jgi:hypothetical protein
MANSASMQSSQRQLHGWQSKETRLLQIVFTIKLCPVLTLKCKQKSSVASKAGEGKLISFPFYVCSLKNKI